jgi:predicted permease
MAAWWSRRDDGDFREEIDAHLALEAERLVKQRGMDPAEARFAARRAFGNVGRARERFHESSRWAWAERLRQHTRYALRALAVRPGFALAAILTLGIGVGFNTVIFTIFYGIAYRDLPVREPDRLINVYQQLGGDYSREVHGGESMVSYPEYLGYLSGIESARSRGGAIAGAAAYSETKLAFDRSAKGEIRGEYVSCNYFPVIGARVVLGRGFVAGDCGGPGSAPVAVVAHDVWTRDLGGDSTAIGSVIRLNQVPLTIVGVAEPGFGGLQIDASGVWVPATMQPTLAHGDSMLVRDMSWMLMAARLAPGGTIERARAELSVSARRRDALYPGRVTQVYVARGALFNSPEMRTQVAPAAVLIGLLGALVVAMVCANLMNLLLARGIARRREIGIRLAIGASRGRLIEQLLTESTLLAALGGMLGFLIAFALPPVTAKLVPVTGLQLDLRPDGSVLGFSIVASVFTALVFGLVPALQATKVDLVSAAKGGMSLGGRQVRPSRVRAFVVGTQVAGSALLLIVAALFIRAATRAASVSPGYATGNVVAFGLNLRQLGYNAERTRATLEALRDRVAALPGVESAALVEPLPLLGRHSSPMRPDGTVDSAKYRVDDGALASVSGEYLATMQIPIVAGRAFSDADARAAGTGDRPVVISQSLSDRLWPGQSAVGRRMLIDNDRHVVTGVAADVQSVNLGRTTPFAYKPFVPGRDERLQIVARVKGPMAPLEQLVPKWADEIDDAIVVEGQRLSARVALELAPARLMSAVAATMGALALLLALVGIYGVVSFAVAQHTREIAVRLALGSSQREVVKLMMRQGSTPVVVGLGIGLAASVAVGTGIRGALLGVSPLDPITYLVTGSLLMAAAFSAMYLPALRAARVDPALPLRAD